LKIFAEICAIPHKQHAHCNEIAETKDFLLSLESIVQFIKKSAKLNHQKFEITFLWLSGSGK